MEVSNPFLPLEVTEAELTKPQELPEKRKSEGQRSLAKSKRKEKTPPALKAAGGDQSPYSTPVEVNTPELVGEAQTACNSRPGPRTERLQTAASRAQAGKSSVEVLEEAVVQALERPYTTSYFLPGKLEGKPVQFLVDTGCTTNLLSKHVFDRLPERIKCRLEESDSHGVMADGTQLPF